MRGLSTTAAGSRHARDAVAAPATVKRAVDVVGAVVLLVLTAPLLLGAIAATAVTSRGPVLFRQTRVGLHGAPFVLLKLRTMRQGNDDLAHRDYVTRLLAGTAAPVDGLYKLARDPRITR